jgi:integrase
MEWVTRWGYTMAPKPSKPGVWRLKDGGYLVRASVVDPRTKKPRKVLRVLRNATLPEAVAARAAAITEETTLATAKSMPLWSSYAGSLFKRKTATGEIKSAATVRKWQDILRLHLIPAFGKTPIDEVRRIDIEAWRAKVGERIVRGKLKPSTANTWLNLLKTICNAAVADYELERNPVLHIVAFDESEHPTYTEEQPNSLTATEARAFLTAMAEKFPQHYAMTLLGFVTGLRPSSLRALRRRGQTPDVLWSEGAILVRRSNADRQSVMNTTKTKRRQKISLPPEVMQALEAHVTRLKPAGQRSELLFPSRRGGFRSRSCLDKPFDECAAAIDLQKSLTPRAMRRTFQDLARAARVPDLVTRSISGHATAEMQEHYSTVWQEEQRASLAQVIDLVGVRVLRAATKGQKKGQEETG